MIPTKYLKQAGLLLDSFESMQSYLLKMDLNKAAGGFKEQIKGMHRLFSTALYQLTSAGTAAVDELLLVTQLERLLTFLKELSGHTRSFVSSSPPDEKAVIFIFERQHIFKNIYRKHLQEFERYLSRRK